MPIPNNITLSYSTFTTDNRSLLLQFFDDLVMMVSALGSDIEQVRAAQKFIDVCSGGWSEDKLCGFLLLYYNKNVLVCHKERTITFQMWCTFDKYSSVKITLSFDMNCKLFTLRVYFRDMELALQLLEKLPKSCSVVYTTEQVTGAQEMIDYLTDKHKES